MNCWACRFPRPWRSRMIRHKLRRTREVFLCPACMRLGKTVRTCMLLAVPLPRAVPRPSPAGPEWRIPWGSGMAMGTTLTARTIVTSSL